MSAASSPSANPTSAISVSQAAAHLEARIKSAFEGRPVWVRGVLDGMTRQSKSEHKFFALIEHSDDNQSKIVARLSAVMWRTNRNRINARLRQAGMSEAIRDGTTVSMLGTFGYYRPGGTLSFHVSDVDIESLRAERLLARERTINTLRAEGLLELNRALSLPTVPQRVALVTSPGSAAHHDIERVLRQSEFAVRTTLHATAVQGDGAPSGIVAALRHAAAEKPDVILLCRGGGRESDLRVFDDLEVARAVANCPIPVFAGVGHDIDSPAVDNVAHTAFSTPTAAAEGVMKLLRASAQRVSEVRSNFEETIRSVVRRLHDRVRSAGEALERDLQRSCHQEQQRHKILAAEFEASISARLASAQADVNQASELLDALDPASRLRQGWSLSRRANGLPVTSYREVEKGELITTLVADGHIASRVEHATAELQTTGAPA